jgi:hypothetical protein
VPADPSSPIPAALTRLAPTDPLELQDAEAPHLLAYLAAVPDPRAARGRLHRLVAILALAAAAVLDRTRDRGHGRTEIRTLKAVSVSQFGFPHAAQVLRVTRKTRNLDASPRRFRTVTVYAITSLPFEQARPARLADLMGGHWAIEALHHVRDISFAEDASQVRTGAAPSAMACLRNLVIGVLCRAGPVNVAAALRRHARDSRRPLATLGISLG